MIRVRVALGQINTTVGDLDGNAGKIVESISRAREMDADIVALPELAVTGYPPEDLVFRAQFVADNRAALDRVIAASGGLTAVVGFVDAAGGAIYNSAAIIHDGDLVDVYHKHLLPNYGVFDEQRYFRAGTSTRVYGVGGASVAVNVCEDIWRPDGPIAEQAALGAGLIVNINGSPYHRGKREEREAMLAERAGQTGAAIAYVNVVGGQDELVFDGGSIILSPSGETLARAPQFEEALVVCDIPLDDRAPGTGDGYIAVCGPAAERRPIPPPIRAPALDDVAEVYAALVTGTRDYAHKSGFGKAIVALSGGIDSSLVAAIAADALGAENVLGISMPSRYSSEGSVVDAQDLSEGLGIRLLSSSIEPPFSAYLETLEPMFGGAEPDVTEENLQARVRGTIVMALSNKFGYLALTTGNKSEYATGYATLYGDMSGGFAVIKDVPKTLAYDLCRYRNTISAVIPESVIDKPPSAELRPDQLDADSLPPYEVLDPILKAYVEEDLPYGDIVGLGHPAETVRQVISLVDRAEYKRRQAPPGIKITERNFGRDRRMPIINRYQPY